MGSGNLGGVWFAREPGRLTLEELEVNWPGLAAGLARHPRVSFIMVQTADQGGPVILEANGLQRLLTGEVAGSDPLAPFEASSAKD